MKIAALVLAAAMLSGCGETSNNESNTLLNNGNKALQQNQFDTAINYYQKSTEKNRDNSLAWYGMGLAYIKRNEYDKAADSLAHTVQLAEDQGMYQMYYGIALYEKAVDDAKDAQAKKANKKKEEISDPDLATVDFKTSDQHLQQAIKMIPDLWRAHRYLGKIYNAQDKAKEAAEQFTTAIKSNPREWAPYVALTELYRKWDYTDQAIQVARAGTTNVPGTTELSDVWYELGVSYDDKRNDDEAIKAFTESLNAKHDNHRAQFQRGYAYFRKGDMEHAKRDLEDFSKAGGASLDFAKQQAQKMLMDIAAKAAGAAAPPADKKASPEDVVKQGKGGKGKGGK
jgi:tetratricopeptide (TPR) repeat protein